MILIISPLKLVIIWVAPLDPKRNTLPPYALLPISKPDCFYYQICLLSLYYSHHQIFHFQIQNERLHLLTPTFQFPQIVVNLL